VTVGDPAAGSAVELAGVSKVFNPGRANETHALEGIDLSVGHGELVTLIGPSGCGKSTLLRLMAALIEPSRGTVTIGGKPAEQARLDRDYGMAFQRAGLFDWRTVAANIELPLELMGWSRPARRARALEMLELIKLREFADHRPRELSGGMQQRVAIARSLSFSPPLLLMDEPFGALDEMTREHMQDELLRIWAVTAPGPDQAGAGVDTATSTTVVFVTHSVAEAVYLSTKVVVMSPRPGRIATLIDVDLGHRGPTTREDPAFFAKVTEVREALRAVGA
jgi:NitT/TauT family transport system ATP-binding protein